MNNYVVMPLLIVGLIYFTGFLFGLGYFTASKFFHHKTILGGSLNIGPDKKDDKEIERLMDNLQKQDDAALAELQRRQNKITQLKYEIARVTAERDAAIKDVHKAATGRYCEICDHDCIGHYFGFAACSDFKYCGLQKEDNGNDN